MKKPAKTSACWQRQTSKISNPEQARQSKATSRRADPTYASVLVPAIMAIAISFAVSLVETLVRLGFTPGLVLAWLTTFAVAVIVAVPTAVLVAPHVQRLVSRITGQSPAAQVLESTEGAGCPSDDPRPKAADAGSRTPV